jgi:hypothetical protein
MRRHLTEKERAAIRAQYPKPPAVDRRPKAPVVDFPPKLTEQELTRRQLVIDAAWERTLAARREVEEAYSRTCHRGPGDPDWRG